MKIILIISIILNLVFILFFIFLIKNIICLSKSCVDYEKNNEEHVCNDCRIMFVKSYELNYKYCPYCSKKLTLHSHNPNFKEEEIQNE